MAKEIENKAPAYAWMIVHLQSIAREHGYALAVHGSMARDLDLVAVPWTQNASPEDVLVKAIKDAVSGHLSLGYKLDGTVGKNPETKPHGRKAYTILFCGHYFYIDLSVMPLGTKTEQLKGIINDLIKYVPHQCATCIHEPEWNIDGYGRCCKNHLGLPVSVHKTTSCEKFAHKILERIAKIEGEANA